MGGGIVGAARFYKLQRRHPEARIALLEKEDILSDHQTGHNSGVIHSGLYYPPGSLKATNCVKGRHELVAFAKEYGVEHDVCGKVVAAATEDELPMLEKIHGLGIQNKIEGLGAPRRPSRPRHRAPCQGRGGIVGALHGHHRLPSRHRQNGGSGHGHPAGKPRLHRGRGHRLHPETPGVTVHTPKATFTHGDWWCARACKPTALRARMGWPCRSAWWAFRGDYYELEDHAKHKVRNLIYPVPNPQFPFLGVHFTRMTNGDIECGPNAVFTFKREGYGKTDFSLKDTAEALGYGGTWRLFFKNMSFGINEYRRAFSKKLFLKTLQRLVPSLEMDDLRPGRSGVRALLLRPDGDTKDDFRIISQGRSVHVLNAPSPSRDGLIGHWRPHCQRSGQPRASGLEADLWPRILPKWDTAIARHTNTLNAPSKKDGCSTTGPMLPTSWSSPRPSSPSSTTPSPPRKGADGTDPTR